MNLESIKENLVNFLSKKDLKLFDIKYLKGEQTLSILLDEKMDMNQIEEISNEISNYLDEYENEFDDNYILDVSTVGAERPIRNEEELTKAIGEYIFIKIDSNEYYRTLNDYKDGIVYLQIKDKTRNKNIELSYDNTNIVRYAVKF